MLKTAEDKPVNTELYLNHNMKHYYQKIKPTVLMQPPMAK